MDVYEFRYVTIATELPTVFRIGSIAEDVAKAIRFALKNKVSTIKDVEVERITESRQSLVDTT